MTGRRRSSLAKAARSRRLPRASRHRFALPGSALEYASFLKKPEIDLSIATKFVDLKQKRDFTKYLSAYSHIQNKPMIQKDLETTKNLDINTNDIQKVLSKTEKEIY